MARSRYRFVAGTTPHFLTATTVNWTPVFASRPIVQFLLESLKFLQNEDRLVLYAFVIMENHLHLVAASEDLSKTVASFKSYTARQIIDFLTVKGASHVLQQLAFYKAAHKRDRDYQLWQEGSHPQLIQGEAMMRQKVEYIHNNPVARGYVDLPIHWRNSSARNYAGMEGVIHVNTRW
jgi:REP element-mobilizing transposase RayT